ncbi:MAG: LysE family translocator [Devosia sp.]|uniref:LysE family translocator n=1 Tax=Devosia sp. TaxID=1871048 RepID=UPI002623A59B|nr:LysE family translocator [Devosia sp.]MDB5585123.1 LysE family translocator [Devosia sp.]
MAYTDALWIYLVLVFGIIVVPGMDMLFVLANALTGGRRAGLAATGGIMAGGVAHTIFGATAVGVLARSAPGLLSALVLVGAAYMAWIGITLMRTSITVDAVGRANTRSQWVAFRQGLVTCLLNPKAYLFTFSVFPQFIRPEYGPVWSQALVIGIITVLMQLTIYGGLALAAGRSRDFLVASPQITIWIGRGAGLLFLVVAVFTAWHGLAQAK